MDLDGEAAATKFAESRERPFRFVRQLAIGLVVLVVIGVVVKKVPPWLVEKAMKSSDACQDERERSGDLDECRRGVSLAIGKLFPHSRVRAKDVERIIESNLNFITRQRARRPGATPADRAAAIANVLASRDLANDKAQELIELRALEEAAKIELGTDNVTSHAPVRAALWLGDVARAKAAIASGVLENRDFGALACLLGQRQRGLEILARYDTAWRHAGHRADGEARIAAIHCGATLATFGGEDPTTVLGTVHEETAFVAQLFDPAFQVGRRAVIGEWLRDAVSIHGHTRIAGVALLLGSTAELTPKQVLVLAIGRLFDDSRVAFASPWSVFGGGGELEYVPPEWFVVAAARVEATIGKPIGKITDDDPGELRRAYDDRQIDPTAVLATAASTLHVYAAAFELRRGRREQARVAIEKAAKLAPAAVEVAVLQLAANDARAALETLDRAESTSLSETMAAVAKLNRVLAHAALGEHRNAHRVALEGLKTGDVAFGWLAVATAMAAKQPLPEIAMPRSDFDKGVAPWLAFIKSPAAEEPTFYEQHSVVRPATYAVIAGAAIAKGEDPEAFLDRFFEADIPSRSTARARAEAARWRGDAAAAKRWDDRARAIEKLFVDDKAAALAGLAGVW